MVLPLLQKVAARDARGKPCVGRCGMGGSGSFELPSICSSFVDWCIVVM